MAEGARFYYLQGTVASLPAVLEWDNTDLAIMLRDVYDWIIPLPINANYTMTVSDLVTGAVIFEGQPAPPATDAQTTVHLQKAISNDITPPYVIGGSPLTLSSWRIGAAEGTIRDKIKFTATDNNNDGVAELTGDIQITGEAEALPEGSAVAIHNNATGNGDLKTTAADGGFSITAPFTFGDPVTLLLSSVDVEPGATIRFNFSEPIKDGNYASLLQFYETGDTSKTITVTTKLLSAQQILEIKPSVNLKSSADYTIMLKDIEDLAGNKILNQFEVQFRTKTYDIIGSASSGTVNDTLLLKDHLLVGKDNGVEVYSTANPFDMGTPIATLQLAGGVRSFAKYGNYVLTVGGGVAPNGGILRQLDFTDFQNPRLVASLILTRFVGDTTDDQLGDQNNPVPEGRPIKVMAIEGSNYVYVATLGVGVQIIDISHIGLPIYNAVHRIYKESNLKDITLYVKPDENIVDLVLSGLSMHHDKDNTGVSLKAVDTAKVIAGACQYGSTALAEQLCQVSAVKSTVIPGTANNVEVLQNYEVDIDQDGRTGLLEDGDAVSENPVNKIVSKRDAGHTDPHTYEIHDLAFIGSGIYGIHVVDITDIKDPQLLGTIKVGEGVSVSDLKLDSKNLRLYAPVGSDGIYIVDIKDPFLINPNLPPQVIGKIQIGGTITDGNVTIDPELNTVYVATKDQGLKSVLVGKLNVEIATDKDNDGVFEHVGVIPSEGQVATIDVPLPQGMVFPVPIPLPGGGSVPAGTPIPAGLVVPIGATIPPGVPLSVLKALPPTKYYLVGLLPSGAGGSAQEVKVKVSSTTFFDQPVKLADNFPDTEFEATLKYKAPVDTNKDSYRLYVSDPFYITAHPLLPAVEKIEAGAKVIAAGDFIRADFDEAIRQNIDFVTTDLLRQSRFATKAIRMDYVVSEKPEPKQNPTVVAGAYLHSGEWTTTEVDLSIKGRGIDFAFARSYESQSLYDGPLGAGWDHAYFARLLELPSGDVIYYDGMGRKEIFYVLPPPPLPGPLLYASWFGEFAELAKLEDGNWRIYQPDGTEYLFNNYGQLAKIADRNQNALEFLYDPAGRLSVVLDTMGRPINYQYNEDGKLESIKDFAAREIKFAYDDSGNNLLTDVTSPKVEGTPNQNDFPNGKTVHYNYKAQGDLQTFSNLINIVNPKNETTITNLYDSEDRLEKQTYGLFDVQFTYEPQKTSVRYTSSRTHVFDLDFAGHTTKRSVPLPPPLNGRADTSYEYNLDGLVTRITLPEGGMTDYAYDSTNLLCRRCQANLLNEKMTPDAKGDSVTPQGETPLPITKSYVYGSPHNQVISTTNGRNFVTSIIRDGHGNPKEINYPADGIKESYSYNKYGQVELYSDPLGNTDTYEYFSESESAPSALKDKDNTTGGYLKKVTLAAGSTSNEGQLNDASPAVQKYDYDDRGNVIIYTDARGVKTTYVWNTLDQMMVKIDAASNAQDGASPLSYQTEYKYDENDNMVDVRMIPASTSEESHTVIERDEFGRQKKVKRQLDQLLLVTRFEYDERGNVREVRYPKDNTSTTLRYDARDLLIEKVEALDQEAPQQGVFSYEYDKDGNLKKEITPDIVNIHEYDGFGREVKTVFGEGNYASKQYDPNGNVKTASVRDQDDNLVAQSVNVYDPLDRVTSTTQKIIPDPNQLTESQTQFAYDKNSRLINQYSPNNELTHFVYDGLDRLRQQIDADQNAVVSKYDGNGNVIEKKQIEKVGTDEEEFVYTYKYDAANRLGQQINPGGTTMGYLHDERGNVTATIDERQLVTQYKYDGLDRQTSQKTLEVVSAGCAGKPEGDIQYKYDVNSNRTDYIDPCGHQTIYGYDLQNRLTSVAYPDGTIEQYNFKTGGSRLDEYIQRALVKIKPTYDRNNRIKRNDIQHAGFVSGTTFEIYDYDALGRIIRAENDDSIVDMKYNSLGHMLEEKQKLKSTGLQLTVGAEYDRVGNRTAMTYPNGMVVSSQHDLLHRPLNFYADSSLVSDYDYAGPRRIHEMNFGNTANVQWSYDAKKRVKDITFRANNQKVFDGIGLTYDDSGNKLTRTHLYRPQFTESFKYTNRPSAQLKESLKLVPQATVTAKPSFNLVKEDFDVDKADRINRYIENDLPTTINSFNENNQPKEMSTGTGTIRKPLFDLNGNQVEIRLAANANDPGTLLRQISYDYRNHPVSVTTYNSNGSVKQQMQYQYDAFGRRIQKNANGAMNRYLNFGDDVIEETDGSGTLIADYVYQGIDRPVAMFRNTTDPENRVLYFHTDDNGNVTSLTNETGEVVERYFYKAYGEFRITADTEAPEVLSIAAPADAAALDITFSEEMSETALTSIRVNGNADGTAQFTDAEHTKVRFTFNQATAPGTVLEIAVTTGARDLSMRTAIPVQAAGAYSPEAVFYTNPDSTLYTGEKIIPQSTVANLLTFQGARYEPEINMYYLRNRLLDVDTFQFISADPLGVSQGPNAYAFVGNNPVNRRDPPGLYANPTTAEGWQDIWEVTKAFADITGYQIAHPALAVMAGILYNDPRYFLLGSAEILTAALFQGTLSAYGPQLIEAAIVKYPWLGKSIPIFSKSGAQAAEAFIEKETGELALKGFTQEVETVASALPEEAAANAKTPWIVKQRFDATKLTPQEVDTAILKSIRRASGARGNAQGQIVADADQIDFILRKTTAWRRNVHASNPNLAALPPELKGTLLHSSVSTRMRGLGIRDLIINQRLYGQSQFISPTTGLPYTYRIPDFRLGSTILDIKPFGTPLGGPQYIDFMNFANTNDVRWIYYNRY